MKVCILGAGSLGSTIGGALAAAGNQVHLVGRKPHMDAVNANGLVMVTPAGNQVVHPQGHTDPTGIGPCDLVIVLCKAFDTEATMKQGACLVGPDTVVMSLQNGLGAEDVLCETVGAEHVIGGKTYIGGMLLEPGRVQATIPGKDTFIGELDGSITDRVKDIARTFEEAGMHCVASDNIMGVIWDKLLVNVATGALCGITRLPYGDMYQEKALVNCALAAVQEGIDVAHAAGVTLTYRDPADTLELARAGLPYSFKPSILQSLEKHRPTEVGVINGAVVAQGRKYGVPTPVNETLTACVMGIERYIREYVNG
ncbi:MAG: ketopantoate reductase family protein [Eggerthellaceae bacterium]|jgi:2-dehydropantoate 2-reductase